MLIFQRVTFVPISLLVVLVFNQTVLAQGKPALVVLNWARFSGAHGCIEKSELEQIVESRLGRKVFAMTRDADWIIQGQISVDLEDAWQVYYFMYDKTGRLIGQRHVTSRASDCRELDETLSLLLILMVESLERSQVLQQIQKQVDKRTTPLSKTPNIQLDVSPATAFSVGYLPQPVFGFSFATSLFFEQRFRSIFALTLWDSAQAKARDVKADIFAWDVELDGCLGLLDSGFFHLEACLGVQLGQSSGVSSDLSVRLNPQPWQVIASGGSIISFDLDRYFFIRCDLSAKVPLQNPRFFYFDRYPEPTEADEIPSIPIWQSWGVFPVARLGVGFRTP